MWFLENAWLIPVVPAVAFFLIIFFGKHLPMKGAEVGIAALASSWVLAMGAAYQWIQHVDDALGGSEGAFGKLGSLGRSLVARAGEGEEAKAYVSPIHRTWVW